MQDRKPACHDRPTEPVRPRDERVRRALQAIADGRIDDAEGLAATCPPGDPHTDAWRAWIDGLICRERGRRNEAETHMRRAAAAALERAFRCWRDEGGDGPVDSDDVRLGAAALHELGGLARRKDLPERARRLHLAAFSLRLSFGSLEELWQSAGELGVDYGIAQRHDMALYWQRMAARIAAGFEGGRDGALAQSWAAIARCLLDAGHGAEAVEAARTAAVHQRAHDVTGLAAVRADLLLGHTLLKLGEAYHEHDAAGARAALHESVATLTKARESALAFGPNAAADAAWCAEQRDFAQRLLASLDL